MSVLFQRIGDARDWCDGKQLLSHISACALRELRLSCLGFPRLSDAVDDRADGGLSMLRAIKLIVGPDFAVSLSSPDSFCVLFDTLSKHSAELKWLMLYAKDGSLRHV